jgi:hypothetical protein
MAPGSSSKKQRDYDYLFKLVLIGDSGVGKSCLLLRFAVCFLCRVTALIVCMCVFLWCVEISILLYIYTFFLLFLCFQKIG